MLTDLVLSIVPEIPYPQAQRGGTWISFQFLPFIAKGGKQESGAVPKPCSGFVLSCSVAGFPPSV